MLKINKTICPLCKQESEYIPIDFGRKRKFNCPNCMKFLISSLLEETISEAHKLIREKISKKSTLCQSGTILHIYTKNNEIISECVLESNWY